MPILISYPNIDPVLIAIGPFPIRWYALAYIAGLAIGWAYARALVRNDLLWRGVAHPDAACIDDLLFYAAIGVILGGRIGYVLFYNPAFYLAHPEEIPAVWKGGMAFHGGVVGTGIAIYVLARRRGVSALSLGDVCSAAAPIGLFLGRIANFIKPELWGRPTDVAWAMVFPAPGLCRAIRASFMRRASKASSCSLAFMSRFGSARSSGRVSSPGFSRRAMGSRGSPANFFASRILSLAFYSAARPWACSCRCR